MDEQSLIYRLRKRAEIRRQITTRKSVQEGKPDRISDLLEEAATEIDRLRDIIAAYDNAEEVDTGPIMWPVMCVDKEKK